MFEFPGRQAHVVCSGAASFDSIFRMEKLPTGPGKVLPLHAVEVAEVGVDERRGESRRGLPDLRRADRPAVP